MPRPQRCRRVCSEPEYSCFEPEGVTNPESVVLSVDEYEVIRLVDLRNKIMNNVRQLWIFHARQLQKYMREQDIKFRTVL